jgi:hypothetical protein
MSRTYIQLGAGAGDLDPAVDYRDGFTEAVKALPLEPNDRIILVEANPYNIPMLRECWQGWPQAEVLNIGIRPSSESSRSLRFFYVEEDAPHYQVFSLYPDHVRKLYPHADLKSVEVESLSVAEFITTVVGDSAVELLAIDIEGADAAVMLDVDWRSFDCRSVSFEYLHLGPDEALVRKELSDAGFRRCGVGVDPGGFDVMYRRGSGLRHAIHCALRELRRYATVARRRLTR